MEQNVFPPSVGAARGNKGWGTGLPRVTGLVVCRWSKAHSLLCQQRIQKFQIAQVVGESTAMLR